MSITINEIEKIIVEFTLRKPGKRINPGFFPYINTSDIDLKRYGIFCDINDPSINESCLIQSIESSKVLTDDELKMLKSFVKTRTVPQAILNEISNLFKLYINCKILYESGKISHVDFGMEFKENRSLKLIIIDAHYILNERTNISECYIRRYQEINNDVRFKNHPRKMMLQKFDTKRYAFAKQGMKISKLIQLMIEHKLLIPMTEKQMNRLEWSFKPTSYDSFDGISRKIVIGDKKTNAYKETHKVLQSKHFFGYIPYVCYN